MAKKNMIQFQKGISLIGFFALYGEEQQCQEQFFQWRGPEGFVCPIAAA